MQQAEWQFIFFSWKTNSCGVAIVHVGSKFFVLANQTTDKNGRFLLTEANFLHSLSYAKYYKTMTILEIRT